MTNYEPRLTHFSAVLERKLAAKCDVEHTEPNHEDAEPSETTINEPSYSILPTVDVSAGTRLSTSGSTIIQPNRDTVDFAGLSLDTDMVLESIPWLEDLPATTDNLLSNDPKSVTKSQGANSPSELWRFILSGQDSESFTLPDIIRADL